MINPVLLKGDCLKLMSTISAGSVDLILCNLPYGTIKGLKLDSWNDADTAWDNRLNTEDLFKEYERILRRNRIAILFSQEPYTRELRGHKQENLSFLYPMVWIKNIFGNPLGGKKTPVSYFEDLSVFAKDYDRECRHPLREYFRKIYKYAGFNGVKSINKHFGHRRLEHSFQLDSLQFTLCAKDAYQELAVKLQLEKMPGFLSWEQVSRIDTEFKQKYKRVFNLNGAKHVPNVLRYAKEAKSFHPTQKPTALLEYLIKTYTNPGDVVLDNCMGSGSTGVAAVNCGRRFIGMELTDKYFAIAKSRIEAAQNSLIPTLEAS